MFRYLKSGIVVFLVLLFSCTPKKQSSITQNNLGAETSLYLQQHAKNPVHWQPWKNSVYESQNSENKLVVVSIGYSSCHWCHVMEKETFEDTDVSMLMNENFINIKVDREENPDIDKIYMTATQLMTGSGGWPLNVVCLPDGRPIYGGTYHTKSQWSQVLAEIQKQYKNDPDSFYEIAEKIAAGIQNVNLIEPPKRIEPFTKTFLENPVANWITDLDFVFGGELRSEKFINPVKFAFLRAYQTVTQHDSLQQYVDTSLSKIAKSGVYDPIEGGVFRYSIDSEWEVPHFEKMLYDNAQVIGMYADAYKQNKNPLYKDVIEESIGFLKQKMASDGGGLYAAIDADNAQGEGRYYLFSKDEIDEISGDNHDLFYAYYRIDLATPIEEEFYALKKGYTDTEFIAKHKLIPENWVALKRNWDTAIAKKLELRDHPGIDKKIITSWNAMAIIGLTKAAQALNNTSWLRDAESRYLFLLQNLYVNKTLYHTYQNSIPKVKGFLSDYAFMAAAALELYKTTGKVEYLEQSKKFIDVITNRFKDDKSPFFTFKMEAPLISNIIELDDGVIPSANAQVAHTLYDLGELLGDKVYTDSAIAMLQGVQPYLKNDLSYYSLWGLLMLKMTFPRYELVVCGPDAAAFTVEIHKTYLPNVLVQQSENQSTLPLLKNRFVENETYIYVCENQVCYTPDNNVKDALERLENLRGTNSSTNNPFVFPKQ